MQTDRMSRLPRRSWSEADQRRIVAEWKASGLKPAEFCRRRGIVETNLWRWRKRLAAAEGAAARPIGSPSPGKRAPAATLLPVRVVEPRRRIGVVDGFEVRLGDIEVSVPAKFDPAALKALLVALRASCSR